MRALFLIPVAALAACEGEQKAKAPPAAAALQAGQWESSFEVGILRELDEGRPRLNLPAGTRVAASACVAPDSASRPPPELFVGDDFQSCRWGENFYMRNGRLNSAMTCRRRGIDGNVEVTVNVDFTATSFEGSVEFATRLVSDGDVHISATSRGRRTGECAPSGEGAGNEARPG